MKKVLLVAIFFLFAGIVFGQTLKKGGMIAIHEVTVTLDPDVTMNQLLDFLESKWFPGLNELMEGVTMFGAKGDRGEKEGTLAWVVYCESEEARDKYWPEAGSTSAEWSSIMEKIQPVYNEMMKLATFNTVYTEWKIL